MGLLKIFNTIKSPFTAKFIERFVEKAVSQDEFGHKKYGQYLDPMDDYDWLNMAMEEYADLGKYIEAERIKRDHILKHTTKVINTLQYGLETDTIKKEEAIKILEVIKRDFKLISRNLDGMEEGKASKS